jgi:hypothetical protein
MELANYLDIDPDNPKGEYKSSEIKELVVTEEKEEKDEV